MTKPPPFPEEDLQAQLVELAAITAWSRAHFRPARTKHRWVTPGQYEAGKGWPDLILLRPGEVLAWELKGRRADGTIPKPEPEQVQWLEWWAETGAEAALVTPENLDSYAIPRLTQTRLRAPKGAFVIYP